MKIHYYNKKKSKGTLDYMSVLSTERDTSYLNSNSVKTSIDYTRFYHYAHWANPELPFKGKNGLLEYETLFNVGGTIGDNLKSGKTYKGYSGKDAVIRFQRATGVFYIDVNFKFSVKLNDLESSVASVVQSNLSKNKNVIPGIGMKLKIHQPGGIKKIYNSSIPISVSEFTVIEDNIGFVSTSISTELTSKDLTFTMNGIPQIKSVTIANAMTGSMRPRSESSITSRYTPNLDGEDRKTYFLFSYKDKPREYSHQNIYPDKYSYNLVVSDEPNKATDSQSGMNFYMVGIRVFKPKDSDVSKGNYVVAPTWDCSYPSANVWIPAAWVTPTRGTVFTLDCKIGYTKHKGLCCKDENIIGNECCPIGKQIKKPESETGTAQCCPANESVTYVKSNSYIKKCCPTARLCRKQQNTLLSI